MSRHKERTQGRKGESLNERVFGPSEPLVLTDLYVTCSTDDTPVVGDSNAVSQTPAKDDDDM